MHTHCCAGFGCGLNHNSCLSQYQDKQITLAQCCTAGPAGRALAPNLFCTAYYRHVPLISGLLMLPKIISTYDMRGFVPEHFCPPSILVHYNDLVAISGSLGLSLVQTWEVAAVGTLTRNLHPPSQRSRAVRQGCKSSARLLQLSSADGIC